MGSAGEKKGHALGELGLSRQDIFLRRLPRLGSHGREMRHVDLSRKSGVCGFDLDLSFLLGGWGGTSYLFFLLIACYTYTCPSLISSSK